MSCFIFTDVTDYCPWETFRAGCSDSEVLVMRTARYGRMKMGHCVKNNLGYIGCFTDVIGVMDSRCSGRQNCEFLLPDKHFDSLQPCLEDLKSYLEVQYRCVPGQFLNIEMSIMISFMHRVIVTLASIPSFPENISLRFSRISEANAWEDLEKIFPLYYKRHFFNYTIICYPS